MLFSPTCPCCYLSLLKVTSNSTEMTLATPSCAASTTRTTDKSDATSQQLPRATTAKISTWPGRGKTSSRHEKIKHRAFCSSAATTTCVRWSERPRPEMHLATLLSSCILLSSFSTEPVQKRDQNKGQLTLSLLILLTNLPELTGLCSDQVFNGPSL